MKNTILVAFLALALTGCAASRGFWTGAMGGPQVVDMFVHDEVNIEEPEVHLKLTAHQALLASTAFVLWPLAAAYGGASGIYGAYQFHTKGK